MQKSLIDEGPPSKKLKPEISNSSALLQSIANGAGKSNIKVGSRKSQLALFQSNFVVDLLRNHYTNIAYDIVTMVTTGDRIQDIALSKIGEKSLFTKELEVALERQEVHMVVHSLKDLPTVLPPGMVIGAICKRENPYDVAVFSPEFKCTDLKDLPDGSVIGTSSLRRIAQLKRILPNMNFENVRGNLNTRLRKLDESKQYAALILAAAGLIRLDLEHRISKTLSPKECMYAVGQGALAIECRENDASTIQLLSKISDRDTTICCIAERAFMKSLEGGCSVPVAVHTTFHKNQLTLQGGVFSLDGSKSIIESLSVNVNEGSKLQIKKHYAGISAPHLPQQMLGAAENLGENLAELLLQRGAGDILKEVRTNNNILSAPST